MFVVSDLVEVETSGVYKSSVVDVEIGCKLELKVRNEVLLRLSELISVTESEVKVIYELFCVTGLEVRGISTLGER